jgi:DNA-directed RNA polymerase subunit L
MSIERHNRARQLELGLSLMRRRKIYLDARFWIILRDAALQIRIEPAACKLLYHLRRGVAAGRLVCPISASMFLELLKQPYSPGRRIGTAQLIDELSLGVSMVPSQIVMGTEIYSFMQKAKGYTDLYPMQQLIWTKVAYALSDIYLSLTHLPPDTELALQTAFFDHLWECSLSKMVETIGDNNAPPARFEELSRKTNENNTRYKDELRSFAQTYDVELKGVIELAGDIAAAVIHHLAEKDAGHRLPQTQEAQARVADMCRNLLYHAFKKQETRDALRCIHIGTSIHACMRWDKGRKFKPNDYYDFEHATAALSYCDVFLTEGPLHDLVTQPQIKLQDVNGCQVVSNIETAADYIEKLLLDLKLKISQKSYNK